MTSFWVSLLTSEKKLKKTKSDKTNDSAEANIVMEGQRLENGGWYTPVPVIGISGNLVRNFTGRGRGVRPSSLL